MNHVLALSALMVNAGNAANLMKVNGLQNTAQAAINLWQQRSKNPFLQRQSQISTIGIKEYCAAMNLVSVPLAQPAAAVNAANRINKRSAHSNFLKIFIVQFSKHDEGGNRAYQAPEHIGLRIPDVTLCSQKSFGIGWIGKSCQKFKYLV